MATLRGLPMKILVCAMGAVVTMLSVTGFVVWVRKRRGRPARHASVRVVGACRR
jgi:uncharacterized iron-regulated membrane protein